MKNQILTFILIVFSVVGIILLCAGIFGLVFAYVYVSIYQMDSNYLLLGCGLILFLVGFIPLLKMNKNNSTH